MFKLLNLKLVDHPFFNDIDFNFVNKGEEDQGPYITLIIGSNGTGKSQLLRIILDIFNNLALSQGSSYLKKDFAYRFKIAYIIDGQKITIVNRLMEIERNGKFEVLDKSNYPDFNFISFKKNDRECSFEEIPIPNKFIAASSILADKFPYLNDTSKLKNYRYEYLGIRSASNNAYIKSNTKKIINNLLSCSVQPRNIKKFEILFAKLNLTNVARVIYKPGRNYKKILDVFKTEGVLLESNLLYIFRSQIEKSGFNNIKNNRDASYRRVIDDEWKVNNVVYFLNVYKEYVMSEENIALLIDFKTNNITLPGYTSVTEGEIFSINLLVELEILSPNTLEITKDSLDKKPYSLEEASSGEYYLLTTFINILSVIEDDSIIVIDEPEVSLHPNWQMQYIDLLYNTFNNFKSTHFIICSHSHLIVSDLIAEKSSILSIIKEPKDGKIICELFDYDTQGWSPENILYRIFGVITTRNFYFEKDVQDVLSMISNRSDDYQSMYRIMTRLKKFNLTSNDPLKMVIDRIENYLEGNGN